MGRQWGGSGKREEAGKDNQNIIYESSVKNNFSCAKYAPV